MNTSKVRVYFVWNDAILPETRGISGGGTARPREPQVRREITAKISPGTRVKVVRDFRMMRNLILNGLYANITRTKQHGRISVLNLFSNRTKNFEEV